MLATIGQIALISFLVIAVGVIAVVFVRKVMTNGFPDRVADHGSEVYRDALGGPRPHAPGPNWADEQQDG